MLEWWPVSKASASHIHQNDLTGQIYMRAGPADHDVHTLVSWSIFDPLIVICSLVGLVVESTDISCTDRSHDGSYSLVGDVNSPERRKPKNPRQHCSRSC